MAQLPFDPAKLSPADLELYNEMFERRAAQGAGFGGPYTALMNHPQLCRRVEDLGFYLKFQGSLPRDVYQFVVLSVARRTGAGFEWADHIAHAEAAGVPLSAIDALRRDGVLDGAFPAPFDLVAKILEFTLSWTEIPQALQDQGIQRFGVEGFVELVVLSGFYQMFSAINQGFAVSLPTGAPKPF